MGTRVETADYALYVGTERGLVRAKPDLHGAYTCEWLGAELRNVTALVVDRADPLRLYAASRHGIFRSDDAGAHFREITRGLVHKDVWALAQHPASGELFAGTEPPSIFKSSDSGETWVDCPRVRALEDSLSWTFPRPPHIAHVKHIALSENDARLVYGAVEVGWVIRSADGGDTWETIKRGIAQDAHAVTLVPNRPSMVIVATGEGLFRSTNGGHTFEVSDTLLDPAGERSARAMGRYMAPVVVHPARPNVLFTAAAEVPPPFWSTRERGANSAFYRSGDQGATWRRIVAVGAAGEPVSVIREAARTTVIDPSDPDRVYFGMTDGSVWVTEDGGATIRKGLRDLRGWISAIAVSRGGN